MTRLKKLAERVRKAKTDKQKAEERIKKDEEEIISDEKELYNTLLHEINNIADTAYKQHFTTFQNQLRSLKEEITHLQEAFPLQGSKMLKEFMTYIDAYIDFYQNNDNKLLLQGTKQPIKAQYDRFLREMKNGLDKTIGTLIQQDTEENQPNRKN